MDVCVRLHELGRERWMARATACASRVTARLGFEPRACGVRRPRALLGDGRDGLRFQGIWLLVIVGTRLRKARYTRREQ